MSDVISCIRNVIEALILTRLVQNGTFDIEMRVCIETAAASFLNEL